MRNASPGWESLKEGEVVSLYCSGVDETAGVARLKDCQPSDIAAETARREFEKGMLAALNGEHAASTHQT